jgi:hypothetical protein
MIDVAMAEKQVNVGDLVFLIHRIAEHPQS